MIEKKALEILEINRLLVDDLKKNINIKIKDENIISLIDTELISFYLLDYFYYNKPNTKCHNKFSIIIRTVLRKIYSFNSKNVKIDKNNKKNIGVFITNKKQLDVFLGLKLGLKDYKLHNNLVPIEWNYKNKVLKNSINFWKYSNIISIIKNIHKMSKKINKINFKISDIYFMKYENALNKKFDYDFKRIFEKNLKNKIKELIYNSICYVDTGKEILKNYKLDAVIFTNEREMSAKSTALGMKDKIKTFGIQRGIIGDHPEVNDPLTDYFFVNGDFYKNNMIKRGANKEKIFVLGNPRFDYIISLQKSSNISNIKNKFNIPQNKKVFLVISEVRKVGVSDMALSEFLLKVVNEVNKIENSFLLLKAHPNQIDLSLEKRILEDNCTTEYKLCHLEDINELVLISDYVISDFSTVILEAIALEKPVLRPKFSSKREHNYFFNLENYIINFDNLKDALLKIDRNKLKIERDIVIKEHFYKLDGKSSQRVLQKINELIR